jgi:hypothetical protein
MTKTRQHRLNVKKHLANRASRKALRSKNVVMNIFAHGECGLNFENHTWMKGKKPRFILRKPLPEGTSRLSTYNDLSIHVIELGRWSGRYQYTQNEAKDLNSIRAFLLLSTNIIGEYCCCKQTTKGNDVRLTLLRWKILIQNNQESYQRRNEDDGADVVHVVDEVMSRCSWKKTLL